MAHDTEEIRILRPMRIIMLTEIVPESTSEGHAVYYCYIFEDTKDSLSKERIFGFN